MADWKTDSEDGNKLIRYLKLVQEGGQLELLVLRSHLLIEEELRKLVEGKLQHPELFQHQQFGFSQCLTLAKSIYGCDGKEWLWEAIAVLNNIRNVMAHNVSPHTAKDIDEKLNQLDRLVGKNAGVPMPEKLQPSKQRMHWRLASLYSVLCKLRKNT